MSEVDIWTDVMLTRHSIPNMKLDKKVVQRRVDLMAAEGVNFITNAHIGVNVDALQVKSENDAVIVATGRSLPCLPDVLLTVIQAPHGHGTSSFPIARRTASISRWIT